MSAGRGVDPELSKVVLDWVSLTPGRENPSYNQARSKSPLLYSYKDESN